MQNQKPKEKVSIVIPCYNGARLLHNSLGSVLQQTYRNIQVLLVDDGSTDATSEIAETYKAEFAQKDIEFHYYYKENGGAASAINVGLQHYDGEYFFWLDSDDILLPNSIQDAVTFLEANPQFDYCMGKGVVVDEKNPELIKKESKRQPPENETKEIMLHDLICNVNTVFGPGTVMCRKKLIDLAIPKKGIYESREGQNWQLMLPITFYGTRGYLDKTMFCCVSHADSHSHKERSAEEAITREQNFILLCQETINRISKMPAAEKEKWIALVKITHLKNIHRTALGSVKLKLGWNAARELRQLGCTEMRYKSLLLAYVIYAFNKVFSR